MPPRQQCPNAKQCVLGPAVSANEPTSRLELSVSVAREATPGRLPCPAHQRQAHATLLPHLLVAQPVHGVGVVPRLQQLPELACLQVALLRLQVPASEGPTRSMNDGLRSVAQRCGGDGHAAQQQKRTRKGHHRKQPFDVCSAACRTRIFLMALNKLQGHSSDAAENTSPLATSPLVILSGRQHLCHPLPQVPRAAPIPSGHALEEVRLGRHPLTHAPKAALEPQHR